MNTNEQTGLCMETALEYLGWQGGTIHQIKKEFVNRLNSLYYENCDGYGKRVDLAIELLREAGVSGYHETGRSLTLELLKSSMYGNEGRGTVTSLLGL